MRHTLMLALSLATPLVAQRATTREPAPRTSTDIVYEASISDLQSAMTDHRTTSVALVDAYLARIQAYDHAGPALNAIIRLNPRAREDAAAMDAERRAGKVRGPLHGIPIILKDNYSTRDFVTSAGSVALAGLHTPDDAFQVKKLRDAGAIILGKSNMHELASGITTISSIGGQTCNPYDPDRSPGGSSGGSGAAVAASFAVIAWGSDTCGSIRIPSAVHNLFGLRPTKGLSSISGIVPLSHTQDVGGPIARTVRDLAIALDATIGPDPADTATRILGGAAPASFVASLDSTSLRGKRFGLFTEYLGTEQDDAEGARVIRQAVEALKRRGAEVVDVAIPKLDSIANSAGVIPYEFKYDLIDFLASIPKAPVPSLAVILQAGAYDIALEGPLRIRETQGTRDSPPYRAALAARTTTRDMVVAFLDENHLDALLYPTLRRKAAYIGEVQRGTTCQVSAVSGLPALSMPAGFTPDGLPIGIELLGRPLSDASLISFAYDYETATRPRHAPSTTPPLVNGRAPQPATFAASGSSAGTSFQSAFTYDAPHRAFQYNVAVSGETAARVFAISINRDSAGKPGPAIRVLSGPGVASARGTVKLTDSERRDIAGGGRHSWSTPSVVRLGSSARRFANYGIASSVSAVYNLQMSLRRSVVALGFLSLVPTVARAQGRVVDLGAVQADSALPDTTVARIWRSSCGGVAPKDSAIVYGIVRDAKTKAVVPNAYVDVVWSQLVVDEKKQVHQRRLKLDTRANDAGVFGLCGTPVGQFLRIGAGNGARISALVDLPPGERRVVRRDLMVGAEHDSTERGMIYGMLHDVASGGPLANARVVIDDSAEVRTGNDGHFVVRDIATGTRQIEVFSIGMVPVVAAVDVFPGDSTPVTIAIRRVTALDAVRVSASRRARSIIDGLEERRRLGSGYLLEAGEIYAHSDLASVLREFPNTQVDRTHGDITVWTPTKSGTLCQPDVWVDGAKSAQYIFSALHMSEVVAVEMYTRAEAVPAQFKNVAAQRACGAVLLWTTWAFSR